MKPVAEFARELADAYSTSNYAGGWGPCIKMLRRHGYNDQQIEAIIRSKWTRWAADASSARYGRATSADLARFLRDVKRLKEQVDYLVTGTFEKGVPS